VSIVRFLLPFIFTTMLVAAPVKTDAVKKLAGWQSFKQQLSGLSPQEFEYEQWLKKAIVNGKVNRNGNKYTVEDLGFLKLDRKFAILNSMHHDSPKKIIDCINSGVAIAGNYPNRRSEVLQETLEEITKQLEHKHCRTEYSSSISHANDITINKNLEDFQTLARSAFDELRDKVRKDKHDAVSSISRFVCHSAICSYDSGKIRKEVINHLFRSLNDARDLELKQDIARFKKSYSTSKN
jgi:hypothetical protein